MPVATGWGPRRRTAATSFLGEEGSIDRMLREGYSRAMIAAELGMSKATVGHHARRLGLPVRDDFARRYDWPQMQRVIA
jgi:hypothetical protein